MTTIVADTRIGRIGADTYCSSGYRASKLFVVKGKGIFGCAGDDTAIARFEAWQKRKGRKPEQILNLGSPVEGFEALQLHKGRLYVWGTAMRPELVLTPYQAVGSGGGCAWGVLRHGGTLLEALEIASEWDGDTKSPFEFMDEKGRTDANTSA